MPKEDEVSFFRKHPRVIVETIAYILTLGLSIFFYTYISVPNLTSIYILFAGFAITQVGKSIVNNIDLFDRIQFSNQKMEDILTSVDNFADQTSQCRYVGRADNAYAQIFLDSKNSSSAKNTFMLFDIGHKFISPESIEERKNLIVSFLKKGNRWEDIVSPKVWSKENSYINQSYKDIVDNEDYLYEQYVTKIDYPSVNFIIYYYNDQKSKESRKVFFGWSRSKFDPNGHVFSSQDEKIVDVFEKYWESLKSDAMSLKEYVRTKGNTDDIVGLWANVAYTTNEKGDKKHWNNAIMEIKYDHSREIQLNAMIYNSSNKRIGSFRSTSARFFDDQLFISYERASVSEKSPASGDEDTVTNSSNAVMRLNHHSAKTIMEGAAFINGVQDEISIYSQKVEEKDFEEKSIEFACFDVFEKMNKSVLNGAQFLDIEGESSRFDGVRGWIKERM